MAEFNSDFYEAKLFWNLIMIGLCGGGQAQGWGFESEHRLLVDIFFTFICCGNCNVYLKR